jgi:CDP-glucose 4,6-dehydratase
MMRPDLPPIIQNITTDELREQYMVADKARRVLGWAPRFTMDQGLRETIAWYTHASSTEIDNPLIQRHAAEA